jgi:hypothetical protein
MFNSRYVWSFCGLTCLLFLLHSYAFSSCSILPPERMDQIAADDARNQFLKGLYVGCSLITFAIDIYLFARQRRFLFMILFIIVVLAIQPIFLFGEIMAGECGHAGADAVYYGYELVGLLTVCMSLLILRNWRLKKRRESPRSNTSPRV